MNSEPPTMSAEAAETPPSKTKPPSGSSPPAHTLAGLRPELFVALDREKLAELYQITPPQEPSKREALIKEKMAAALLPNQTSRPSVEAPAAWFPQCPLHRPHPSGSGQRHDLRQRRPGRLRAFVPPGSFGSTISIPAIPSVSPFASAFSSSAPKKAGSRPLIFLKNHGVFVAADTPQEIPGPVRNDL